MDACLPITLLCALTAAAPRLATPRLTQPAWRRALTGLYRKLRTIERRPSDRWTARGETDRNAVLQACNAVGALRMLRRVGVARVHAPERYTRVLQDALRPWRERALSAAGGDVDQRTAYVATHAIMAFSCWAMDRIPPNTAAFLAPEAAVVARIAAQPSRYVRSIGEDATAEALACHRAMGHTAPTAGVLRSLKQEWDRYRRSAGKADDVYNQHVALNIITAAYRPATIVHCPAHITRCSASDGNSSV